MYIHDDSNESYKTFDWIQNNMKTDCYHKKQHVCSKHGFTLCVTCFPYKWCVQHQIVLGSSSHFRDLTRSKSPPIEQWKLSNNMKHFQKQLVFCHHRQKLKLLNAAIIEIKWSPFDTVQIENLDQVNILGCFSWIHNSDNRDMFKNEHERVRRLKKPGT